MTTRNYDDGTIDRWRIEPRFRPLDLEPDVVVDPAPPLWKDLALAAVIAALLWTMAVLVFA